METKLEKTHEKFMSDPELGMVYNYTGVINAVDTKYTAGEGMKLNGTTFSPSTSYFITVNIAKAITIAIPNITKLNFILCLTFSLIKISSFLKKSFY